MTSKVVWSSRDLGVGRRVGVHVDHGQRVGLGGGAGERREIGQLLGRGRRRVRGRAVEGRVVVVLMLMGHDGSSLAGPVISCHVFLSRVFQIRSCQGQAGATAPLTWLNLAISGQ